MLLILPPHWQSNYFLPLFMPARYHLSIFLASSTRFPNPSQLSARITLQYISRFLRSPDVIFHRSHVLFLRYTHLQSYFSSRSTILPSPRLVASHLPPPAPFFLARLARRLSLEQRHLSIAGDEWQLCGSSPPLPSSRAQVLVTQRLLHLRKQALPMPIMFLPSPAPRG